MPVYTFNLAGYHAGHAEARKDRFTFGGLSDAAFTLLSVLGECKNGSWPF